MSACLIPVFPQTATAIGFTCLYSCCIFVSERSVSNTWWRHQMETFFALLALCAGNSSVTGEFPSQRPVTRKFDVSLICAWTNGWVNNRDSGDLRAIVVIMTSLVPIFLLYLMLAKDQLLTCLWRYQNIGLLFISWKLYCNVIHFYTIVKLNWRSPLV